MKTTLHIGVRATLSCALLLAVLFVPLLHSAHFHEGAGHGDASVNATCVVCHVVNAFCAECATPADLSQAAPGGTEFSVEPAGSSQSTLHVSEASRAPPLSLS